MPHIIFLLLIASPSFYALGDETASWGSIQSGPSESECRPYIEKALQGASIQDSLNEPRDTDDVGESEKQEEDAAITEASEEVPPDLPETINEYEEKLGEAEVQLETVSDEQEIQPQQSTEESAEVTSQKEESQEKTDDVGNEEIVTESGESQETTTTQEEEKSSDEVVTSNEQNEDTSVEKELDTQKEVQSEEHEAITEKEAETKSETEYDEVVEPGTLTESVEEVAEAEKESDEGNAEELETETTNESEAELEADSENQEAKYIDASNEKDEIQPEESSEDPKEENTKEDEEGIEKLNETEEEELKEESAEIGFTSVSDENQTEKVETTEVSIEQEIEVEQSVGENVSDTTSEDLKENETEETPHEEVLEMEAHVEENVLTEDKQDSEEPSKDVPIVTAEEKETDVHTGSEEISENIGDLEVSHTSEEIEQKSETENIEEVPDSNEKLSKEDATLEGDVQTEEATPEEELSMIMEIPDNLRSREHMAQILRLSTENEGIEKALGKIAESTLRELKKLYDVAIKPLEILYKYRDLSNRHFGDPEIFSKPLILFMGPWSGGKSTIINYLLENEYKKTALRTGAEPSPAYFNIVMWGEIEEVLDGTQLAADWTFSGLQKFGQGLLDRLRGLKLNHPLLEKVNIIEIPGILEIRKQVERLFPFNDACQWFIDRADIIFLVYDPSKLDVGPETEAILDQLKGREMQTRIILNKADQVKPEELMRVQGTLIWNISPLMSSTEPPIMYSTSLWSIPYESGSPTRLLYAQERAFLKDLRDAVDKRVENKIASARRFAVRVRNHAKMVDCYLTTYYNHKSFFGNKKKISDDIIEHPQNYHIYEGLSTLTNISRYDLPDPDVYRDFFRLNPVYEFQQLSSTCTYFRGCPINRLDVSIAYDLPELIGKYKKQVEEVMNYSKK